MSFAGLVVVVLGALLIVASGGDAIPARQGNRLLIVGLGLMALGLFVVVRLHSS